MSKLVFDFNQQYRRFLGFFQKAFPDHKSLNAEVAFVDEFLEKYPFKSGIANQYASDFKAALDEVTAKDPTCFGKFKVFDRIELALLWKEMQDSEKEKTWKSIRNLGHFALTIYTCGEDMEQMENITRKFAMEHKDDPDMELKLFHKMLEGGEYSKQMAKLFDSREKMKNMFANVGTILKASGGEGGSELSKMMFTSGLFSDETFDKIHQGVQDSFGSIADQDEDTAAVDAETGKTVKEQIQESLQATKLAS